MIGMSAKTVDGAEQAEGAQQQKFEMVVQYGSPGNKQNSVSLRLTRVWVARAHRISGGVVSAKREKAGSMAQTQLEKPK